MPKFRDLTGQKFARLTALHPTSAAKSGQMRWMFRCECGTQKEIPGVNVTSGKAKSCGCLLREVSRARLRQLAQATAASHNRREVSCSGIARELRAARIEKGLTQIDLATRAGYAVTAIQKMEWGQSSPSHRLIADCAQALGFRIKLERVESPGAD